MHAENEKPVISLFTILILSLLLVWMSFDPALGALSFYVFSCGATGIVAYLAFEMTGVHVDPAELQKGRLIMEARLTRHVGTSRQPDSREREQLLEWLRRETEGLFQ